MKKRLPIIALVWVIVFSFAATAMADPSPDAYFDFQVGSGVVNNSEFQDVFPTEWNTSATAEIDITTSPHGGYTQSTAKCEVCHAPHRASEADTEMLLSSTVSRACIYCHVVNSSEKMYAGDPTLAIAGDTPFGWGSFYAHTTDCASCHAVHGADCFQGPTVAGLILKYTGVGNLGTIALKVQPEVYGSDGVADKPASYGSLYTSFANMKVGTLSAAAVAAGVTPKAAAITAQCTICHARYAVGEETINANYLNAELFQPATWANANGSIAKIFVGNAANPVSVLPGIAGLTYTATDPGNITGNPGSLIMAYKNHPMKAGNQPFKGAGASAFFTSGNVPVSATGSSVCQSCHNSPESVNSGGYLIQSFPHYTPGYYKFMAAQNQAAFSTPATFAEFAGGRQAFFSNGGRPAIMNDGYCTKCHTQVGIDY